MNFAADITSAVTEAECARLAELATGKVVLEFGSFLGRSTIALASTAAVVHTVDPHPLDHPLHTEPQAGSTLDILRRNVGRYGVEGKVVIYVATSTQVVPVLRPAFDLVFIDAKHGRDDTERHLRLALGCLRLPGVIACHDYGRAGVQWNDQWVPFGVTEAVDEFVARRNGVRLEVIESLAVLSLEGIEPRAYRVARHLWRALPDGARTRLRPSLDRLRGG